MNVKFDKPVFEGVFKKALTVLKKAESTTKESLRSLSRDVLNAHHATENVDYINRLLDVLSPVNRRACVEFYKEFSGFSYDEKMAKFYKKDKKNYDDCRKKAMEFLEDPLNNIWSWANRNLKVEVKAPTIEGLTKYLTSFVAKTQGSVAHAQIIAALFKAGITPGEVAGVLQEMNTLPEGKVPETIGDAVKVPAIPEALL